MLANPWVRLVNNWLHDIGTGLWAACVVALWSLSTKRPEFVDLPRAAYAAVADVTSLIFLLLVVALVVITVTGVPRLLYWRAETPAYELPSKRPALIGKHVAFLVVYGLGTWWAATLLW